MRRLTIWVLLLTLVAGFTAACGDDKTDNASNKDKTTTTAKDKSDDQSDDSGETTDFKEKFIEEVATGDAKMMSTEEAECAADQLDDELSDEAKDAFGNDDESDFTDLPKDDQEAFLQAFDDCVELDSLIESFAAMGGDASMGGGTEVTDCISEKLKETYDSSGELIEAMITESEEITGLFGECVPTTPPPSDEGSGSDSPDMGVDLQAQLEAAGLTGEQATCISGKLQAQYSAEELAQMTADPSGVVTAMTSIAAECGVGG